MISNQDPSAQETLLRIATIASRRQLAMEKCRSIERSDIKHTINGVERLRSCKLELEKLESELESAVKNWDSFAMGSKQSNP